MDTNLDDLPIERRETAGQFEIRLDDELVRISPQERFRVDATPALLSAIEGIVGAGRVHRLGV